MVTNKSKKPELRFKGFSDDWEQRKLGDILLEHSIRTSDFENNPLYSLTIESGVIPKTDRYERSSLVTKKEDLFKVVKPNEFVTNPMNLRFGALGYNTNPFNVSVSGYYDVFSIDDDKCSGFWNSFFKTPIAMKIFDNAATGSLIEKRRVKYSTLQHLDFYMPSEMSEKIRIGKYMDALDHIITLHQSKCDKLKIIKKLMLNNLFPKNGEKNPKWRFNGFNDDWEQRKFSDITFTAGEKNRDNLPYESYSITNEDGFVPQDEKFENGGTMRDADKRMYIIVSPHSFAYNPARINVGSIGYQNTSKSVIVSSLYEVFKTTNDVNDRFLWHWFKSSDFQKMILRLQEGGVRLYFYYDKLCMGSIAMPSLHEQSLIGQYFDNLDCLITLHQSEVERLKKVKQFFLDKMFI